MSAITLSFTLAGATIGFGAGVIGIVSTAGQKMPATVLSTTVAIGGLFGFCHAPIVLYLIRGTLFRNSRGPSNSSLLQSIFYSIIFLPITIPIVAGTIYLILRR